MVEESVCTGLSVIVLLSATYGVGLTGSSLLNGSPKKLGFSTDYENKLNFWMFYLNAS